jgi:hypothetical protein
LLKRDRACLLENIRRIKWFLYLCLTKNLMENRFNYAFDRFS